MVNARIIIRPAHDDCGIEVLENIAPARHFELLATFPMRKADRALAFADTVAEATGTQVDNQMTVH